MAESKDIRPLFRKLLEDNGLIIERVLLDEDAFEGPLNYEYYVKRVGDGKIAGIDEFSEDAGPHVPGTFIRI